MYSHIALMLAEERAQEMRCAAARARRRREARRARQHQRAALHGQAAEAAGLPDSYEDFLCQTASTATREPTAAGRSAGQAVR